MFVPSIPITEDQENRYMLASIIGKRAVQLNKGSVMLVESDAKNTVTVAISEYKAKKLTYVDSKKR